MLPPHSSFNTRRMLPQYIRRCWNFNQMDFELARSQMVDLLLNPSNVYKVTQWRKQTRNQWARDDPAFLVTLCGFLGVAALAYSIAFRHTSPLQIFHVIFQFVVLHFLLCGGIIASLLWWLSNKYLVVHHAHSSEQRVEWLYAFDIHCNAFFPYFLIVYVMQYFLLPVLLQQSLVASILSNVLFLVAIVIYSYITFLGYMHMPFLQNTEMFLYPVVAAGGVLVLMTMVGENASARMISLLFHEHDL